MPAHNVRFASRLHSDSADIRNPMQSFDEGVGWRGAPGVTFRFRSGKWTARLKGLSAGSHEYIAEPVEAGSISSNAVKFTVP
jgi:hypothetical protein